VKGGNERQETAVKAMGGAETAGREGKAICAKPPRAQSSMRTRVKWTRTSGWGYKGEAVGCHERVPSSMSSLTLL
jgi:hypothetical protein